MAMVWSNGYELEYRVCTQNVIFTFGFIQHYILLPSSRLIYETVFQMTCHAYCQYDVTIYKSMPRRTVNSFVMS
jgi:hypothetical protein